MKARALLLMLVPAAQASAQTEWRKYDCNPVLEGTPGGWDAVLQSGIPLYSGPDGYQLWYSGGPDLDTVEIGRATSRDGIHWEKDPASGPVLKEASAPHVYRNGQLFVMHYVDWA